ncbi:MAG: NADAR family protein [Anaerolineaceae bacterium]|nr:NADAR family protein [Anaerolineaceae bacterium]
MENKLEIIGFYHEYDDYGCFSNWYHAEFDYPRGHYINSEQYMMAQKVLTFRQYELANKIMEADDPAVQKKLGGTHFKEFDSEIWEQISYRVVRRAVRAKFMQNPDILEILLGTGNALLAECSGNDTKWGIGIDIHNPDYKNVSNWRGKNYLGRILMEIREELRLEKKLTGTVSFHNAHDDEPIPEWNMTAGELKRIPQYYDAIHAYVGVLQAQPSVDRRVMNIFYNDYSLYEWEIAMHTNMGGGLPVIGFFDMKQDVYDTARRLKLLCEG